MSALPEFPDANDPDALETQEWLDCARSGSPARGSGARALPAREAGRQGRRSGAYIPFSLNTAYLNTIPVHMEERLPGDHALEERIRSFCRWKRHGHGCQGQQVGR